MINKHTWIRDVLQSSTNKPAAKCSCDKFHLTKRDEMDVKTDIPLDDIKETGNRESPKRIVLNKN